MSKTNANSAIVKFELQASSLESEAFVIATRPQPALYTQAK